MTKFSLFCLFLDVYVDCMPMTPPSSNQSSDSEGGASPRHTPPTSPIRQVLVARASGYKYNPATAIYSQPVRYVHARESCVRPSYPRVELNYRCLTTTISYSSEARNCCRVAVKWREVLPPGVEIGKVLRLKRKVAHARDHNDGWMLVFLSST